MRRMPWTEQTGITTRTESDQVRHESDGDISERFPSTSVESLQPRSHAPLVPVAVGLMSGIVLDRYAAAPSIAAFAIVLLAYISFRRRVIKEHAFVSASLIVLAAAGLGALRHGWADRRLPPDHISRAI